MHDGQHAFKSGKLKLVKLEIRLDGMKTAFNKTSIALSNFKSYGDDARAVHQIFVVLSATEATKVTIGGSVTLTQAGNTLTMTMGSSNSSVVTFSAGTTYAYLLCKATWNSAKTQIDKFTDDQWGVS